MHGRGGWSVYLRLLPLVACTFLAPQPADSCSVPGNGTLGDQCAYVRDVNNGCALVSIIPYLEIAYCHSSGYYIRY
eukprot:COSAG05_NODE_11580_length_506_cov_1.270270_1_plen_76_part_00